MSSTSIDLPDHRNAVRDAILSLDFFPSGMETWPVSGENPILLCKKMVENADIYLGIYAHRFGWRPDGYKGKSITELEYDWAANVIRNGKPIPRLCFIMRDDYPWPKDKMEIEAEADLKRFKAKVSSDHVGFFGSPDDLKAQVTVALANYKTTHIIEAPIQWETGAQFDNYTLQTLLGEGGNGAVWLADEQLPDGGTRPVAIKVLRAGISDNPTRVERFKREISSMARIDYAHIVKVFTYGDRAGQLYVIMPYMRGGTFREKLTNQPMRLEDALHWLEQIGAALDYVHDRHRGLIHRDVKPENMLIGEDGDTLYLADFGLVFSTEDDDTRVTNEGKPVGTGRYMAPEQWRGRELTRQTDLYALGILAYELLTGHLPYQHKNDLDLGNAHCEQDLPADEHLPGEILRILRKATAKHPAERYPTARAFLTDLRNWDVDPANLEPRIRDYLKWVTDELYESVRAQFVELKGEETALRPHPVTRSAPIWDDDDDLFARASAPVQADHVPKETQEKELVENVRQRLLTLDKAVLVGKPGSGKSWMLRRLQADYARAWLKDTGDGRGLIPVLVRLNEYEGGSFTDFVKSAMDILAPYHDRLVREGRLVLLCDALNEMPRTDGQLPALLDYLKDVPYFIVSCRVRDYDDDLGDLRPLEQVLLRDLDLPAIRELVTKRLPDDLGEKLWQDIGGTETLMDFWEKEHHQKFWDARGFRSWQAPGDWFTMHSGARLIPLARNPYLGDLLCRTYHESAGTLPASRARLFEQFIAQMLEREAHAAARRGELFPPVHDIEAALVGLAQALQDSGRTVIAHAEAVNAVKAVELLDAATNANILSAEGSNLKFAHQLLQEYFAAKILLEKLEADQAEQSHHRAADVFGSEWWKAGVWRETVVILGEFLGGVEGANRVVSWLAPVTPELALDVITRNGAGLTLDSDLDATTKQALIEGAHTKTSEPDPVGRAAAYRVLGLFDEDKRHGIHLNDDGLPDLDWVPIPDEGQPWTYRDREHDPLPAFSLTRYPVTYRQFQAFLDADDGYDNPDIDWFAGMAADESDRQMADQRFKYWNHPRESVNWYQAMAFCRWLSWKLAGEGPAIPALDDVQNWAVRLPTEFEWEKAARGLTGLEFPYGPEFDPTISNTGRTGIGQTSAPGIFPEGKSPYGIMDMSGNVWEWCLTSYEEPQETISDEVFRTDVRRVRRGGSWGVDNSDYFRASFRYRDVPNLRSFYVGFRCARSY